MNFKTPPNVLEDLIKFQIFLLSTKDDTDIIKSKKFEFNWKEFFINNSDKLKQESKIYYFENPLIENDPITWNYKAIFWGRRANKFRMPAERISEEKLLLANETSAIQSKPKHSSNWDL